MNLTSKDFIDLINSVTKGNTLPIVIRQMIDFNGTTVDVPIIDGDIIFTEEDGKLVIDTVKHAQTVIKRITN